MTNLLKTQNIGYRNRRTFSNQDVKLVKKVSFDLTLEPVVDNIKIVPTSEKSEAPARKRFPDVELVWHKGVAHYKMKHK